MSGYATSTRDKHIAHDNLATDFIIGQSYSNGNYYYKLTSNTTLVVVVEQTLQQQSCMFTYPLSPPPTRQIQDCKKTYNGVHIV